MARRVSVSRNGDDFISICNFTYLYVRGDARCSVNSKVEVLGVGETSEPLTSPDSHWPLAGILIERSRPLVPSVEVGPAKAVRTFELGVSRSLLFDALDRRVFGDNASPRIVRVGFTPSIQAGSSGAHPRWVQGVSGADLEVEIVLADPPALEQPAAARLVQVAIAGLRREDRSFSRSDLAAAARLDEGARTIRIMVKQEAGQRFAREALFAFKVEPRRGIAEEELYPFVFARLRVADARNADATLPESLVLCAATEVPADAPAGGAPKGFADGVATRGADAHGWELSRLWPLKQATRLYRLSALQEYALCVDLAALEFEVERLFSAGAGRLTLELALADSEQGEPAETWRVEIDLGGSDRPLVLVSVAAAAGERALVTHVDRALVIDVDRARHAAALDPGMISLLWRGTNRVAGTVRHLSGGPIELRATVNYEAEQITLAPAAGGAGVWRFELSLLRGSAWLQIENARVNFEVLPPTEARVVALDVGTMAMSMAVGSIDADDIAFVPLGATVARGVPERQNRRELGYGQLMSSTCGVTILECGSCVLPVQVHFDRRLHAWPGLRAGRHREDLENRLQCTEAPLEIHLPLYDRDHEDPSEDCVRERGFASIASVKSQICAYPHLRGWGRFSTMTADLPVSTPHEATPLGRVETKSLLAAALDALLFVYLYAGFNSPQFTVGFDSPDARRRDWDFILTYPASIGAAARQRYREALRFLVDRVQREFDGRRGEFLQRAGRRGRARLRLVPESVAACWALMDSGQLWPKRAGKYRRLILFDIGAGTFDVSAIEVQPGPADEIVCQTVCFSVPLGGDVLDRALVEDYRRRMEPSPEGAEPVRDLASRIEAGKRMTGFADGYLPVALSGDPGERVPSHDDDFFGWRPGEEWRRQRGTTGPTPRRFRWYMIDLRDAANTRLQAYLRAVRKLIVVPTLRASGAYDPQSVDIDIVISGRAGFFPPLRDAIRDTVARTWSADAVVRLASDVLSGSSSTRGGAVTARDEELMKGLVAKGAAIWSRHASRREDTKTVEQPTRAMRAMDSFAVLISFWENPGLTGIEALHDIRVGRRELVVGHPFSAFIVTRPPLLRIKDIEEAIDQGERGSGPVDTGVGAEADNAFTHELIARCLRPIVLSGDPDLVGSPLPYIGEELDELRDDMVFDSICLAGPNDSVVLDCSVAADGRIHLKAEVNGQPRGDWTLSSTFMT